MFRSVTRQAIRKSKAKPVSSNRNLMKRNTQKRYQQQKKNVLVYLNLHKSLKVKIRIKIFRAAAAHLQM